MELGMGQAAPRPRRAWPPLATHSDPERPGPSRVISLRPHCPANPRWSPPRGNPWLPEAVTRSEPGPRGVEKGDPVGASQTRPGARRPAVWPPSLLALCPMGPTHVTSSPGLGLGLPDGAICRDTHSRGSGALDLAQLCPEGLGSEGFGLLQPGTPRPRSAPGTWLSSPLAWLSLQEAWLFSPGRGFPPRGVAVPPGGVASLQGCDLPLQGPGCPSGGVASLSQGCGCPSPGAWPPFPGAWPPSSGAWLSLPQGQCLRIEGQRPGAQRPKPAWSPRLSSPLSPPPAPLPGAASLRAGSPRSPALRPHLQPLSPPPLVCRLNRTRNVNRVLTLSSGSPLLNTPPHPHPRTRAHLPRWSGPAPRPRPPPPPRPPPRPPPPRPPPRRPPPALGDRRGGAQWVPGRLRLQPRGQRGGCGGHRPEPQARPVFP